MITIAHDDIVIFLNYKAHRIFLTYSNSINNDGKGPSGCKGPNQDHCDGLIDNRTCYHCRHTGHIAQNCKAIKTADGKDISDSPTRETSQLASLGDACY